MNQTVKEGKTMATIAYFTFIGTLIAWSMNQEKRNQFASIHIRQAIGLDLLWMIIFIPLSGFDSWWLVFPFYLLVSVLWFFGFLGAIQGEIAIIPFLGNYFQKWFKRKDQ